MTTSIKETGLTSKEAADYIGCSEYTIKKWAREKVIRHYRVGKRIRFRKSVLENWIERQERMCMSGD